MNEPLLVASAVVACSGIVLGLALLVAHRIGAWLARRLY